MKFEYKEVHHYIKSEELLRDAGEGDSVEEYHRHLVEKYDSAE